MAGMLPGVGVPQRRKMHKHRQDSPSSRGEIPITERRDPLITPFSNLDETALRARQRLEQKLGYLHPSPRSGELPPSRSNDRNHRLAMKESRLASKLLGSQWHLKLKRCKSYKNICSVCLEDFQAEQQVTKLSCSHKYHSECVLPWLAAHPHCPYCRRPALHS
ncbi:RING/U-box superfamily protein [Melia azedarach]|uniref:RING/U-box superfamily protein n=1 Tax=Melia azedarach TaxID=155640 RepID=A0ACC1YFE1_MELAZ|nr:RING/U-box superfamily protein [Melia azedarach]